jgi:hypothetical protein
MDVRQRAAGCELRVFDSSESHRARPCRTADLGLRFDPEDLDSAATPGGRDNGRLEPSLRPLDDRRGKGVFRKPYRGRLGIEQVEAEAWPLRIGERRPVGADLGLIEPAAREGIRRRQLDAAMNRMRDSKREPPSTRRKRSRDDAVADVQRLVRLAAVELLRLDQISISFVNAVPRAS